MASLREHEINEDGKLNTIKLLSFARPHMRAFHFAWFCFFLTFFAEFTLPPLFPTLKLPQCEESESLLCLDICASISGLCRTAGQDPEQNVETEGECEALGGTWQLAASDAACAACFPSLCGGLGLSNSQIFVSNVIAVSGTVIVRILFGSLADVIGPRTCFSIILCVFSLPLFFAAAVSTFAELVAVRFFLGFIGASFVVSQIWASQMFAPSVVGLANATVGGWGNLGGGVSNLLMPLIFLAFTEAGYSNDAAWRSAVLLPSGVLMVTGVVVLWCSDDEPRGNVSALRRTHPEEYAHKTFTVRRALGSMAVAARNYRTWILFVNYACCFGIEMAVNANIALYLHQDFGVDQVTAGTAGSLFGLMNLFARSLGGAASDALQHRMGLRGRLWALFLTLLGEGVLLMAFASVRPEGGGLGGAVAVLVLFSLCTQMAEGCTFGVVPLVDKNALGGVTGIVGAGGNAGAVIGNAAMLVLGQQQAFLFLGAAVVAASFTVLTVHFPGVGSVLQAHQQQCRQLDTNARGAVADTVREEGLDTWPPGSTEEREEAGESGAPDSRCEVEGGRMVAGWGCRCRAAYDEGDGAGDEIRMQMVRDSADRFYVIFSQAGKCSTDGPHSRALAEIKFKKKFKDSTNLVWRGAGEKVGELEGEGGEHDESAESPGRAVTRMGQEGVEMAERKAAV